MTIFNIFRKSVSRPKSVVSQLQWMAKEVQVTRKAMKSLRIKITPHGDIKVSCPHYMSDAEILKVLDEKTHWLLSKLASLPAMPQAQELAEGTTVNVWGQPVQVVIQEGIKNQVRLEPVASQLIFTQKQVSSALSEKLLQDFYRSELKSFIQRELPHWQQKMDVSCSYWNIKNMRSKWGSCNVSKKRIWLSLNLAKYPKQCTQMVLVHELVHLLEASHNKRFYQFMDSFLPDWREADKLLDGRQI